MNGEITLSPNYNRPLACGAAVVLAILILATLVLDGGLTRRITLIAIMGYLGGAAVMVIRRPKTPTRLDLQLLQFGFIPIWLATGVVARYAWHWMGRL
jgi:hypothetical protein